MILRFVKVVFKVVQLLIQAFKGTLPKPRLHSSLTIWARSTSLDETKLSTHHISTLSHSFCFSHFYWANEHMRAGHLNFLAPGRRKKISNKKEESPPRLGNLKLFFFQRLCCHTSEKSPNLPLSSTTPRPRYG